MAESASKPVPRRRRDRAATRAALLGAARRRFARDGYDATSVRDIAEEVGVDAALVFRYFGSKRAIFDEASQIDAALDDPLDGPPGELPRRLLESIVFAEWLDYSGEHPLIALLRSSSHGGARARMQQQMSDGYVCRLAELAGGEDAELRAELFSAWMVGIGVLRAVVGTPALRAATLEDVVPYAEQAAGFLLGGAVESPPTDADHERPNTAHQSGHDTAKGER